MILPRPQQADGTDITVSIPGLRYVPARRSADLNNSADLAMVEAVLRDDPSITMLVNNTGVASVAKLLEADIEDGGDDRPQHRRAHAPGIWI